MRSAFERFLKLEGLIGKRHLFCFFLIYVISVLFFDSITKWYHKHLTFLFDPPLERILTDGLGYIIVIAISLFLFFVWLGGMKLSANKSLNGLVKGILSAVSLHYFLIRILAAVNPEAYQLPWRYILCTDYGPAFSDVAALPFLLSILSPSKRRMETYTRKSNKIDWQEDKPITKINEDSFQRSNFAESIAQKILSWKPGESSFNIAITGEWGSGKTSFLNLVKENLEGKAIMVDYIPWSYHSASDLTLEFFSELAAKFDDENSDDSVELARTIKKALNGTWRWGTFLSNLVDYPTSYAKLKEQIEKSTIVQGSKPLVVVVDDMDRLEGEQLLHVLRLIKNIASIKGSYIITSFDKKAILNNLKEIPEPNRYLEKFFQVEVPLGKAPIETGIGKQLVDWMRLHKVDEKHLMAIQKVYSSLDGFEMNEINGYSIWGLLNNYRRLIIFKNSVNARFTLFDDRLDPYYFILIELIRLHFSDTYEQLIKEEIVGSNRFDSEKYSFLATNMNKDSLSPQDNIGIKGNVQKEALEALFPDMEDLPSNAPNDRDYFHLYFATNYYKKTDVEEARKLFEEQKFDKLLGILKIAGENDLEEIKEWMKGVAIDSVEGLLFEVKCLLKLGEYYDGQIDKVIRSLEKIETDLIHNDDGLTKLTTSLIQLCEENISRQSSTRFFKCWIDEAVVKDDEKQIRVINRSKLIEICESRFVKLYRIEKEKNKPNMHVLHKYLHLCYNQEINNSPHGFNSRLINEFISELGRSYNFRDAYLKYCIIQCPPSSIEENSSKKKFKWVFSVSLFKESSSFMDFLEDAIKSQTTSHQNTAVRVKRFYDMGGNSLINSKSEAIFIDNGSLSKSGIEKEDMDPACFSPDQDMDIDYDTSKIKVKLPVEMIDDEFEQTE